MRKLLFVVIVAFATSCQKGDINPESVDFGKFTMKIPGKWKVTRLQGYDSNIWEIRINGKERLSIDHGWYSSRLDVDPAAYHIDFVTIDNKRAKIVTPKDFGPGTTGVYFDSLDAGKMNRFLMSGTGLSLKNQKRFLNVVETLKFKD